MILLYVCQKHILHVCVHVCIICITTCVHCMGLLVIKNGCRVTAELGTLSRGEIASGDAGYKVTRMTYSNLEHETYDFFAVLLST